MPDKRPSRPFKLTEVEEVPPPRRGPRQSEMLQVYLQVMESKTGKVRLDGDPDDLKRFYKSMVQWRRRHPKAAVNVRKDGSAVFVWVDRQGSGKATGGREDGL